MLTLGEFLAGPHHDPDRIDIDPVFAKSVEAILVDWGWDAFGRFVSPVEAEALLTDPFPGDDGLRFEAEPEGLGVIAIAGGRVVGVYLGCDLAVQPEWRGQGIGARLVAMRFAADGCLPTWSLDTPAYTPAGLAAHKSAFRSIFRTEPASSPDF